MLNYDKLGGNLANTTELLQTEEPLVDDLTTIQHIANQCSVYFALCGINCKVNCDLSKSTVNCL